jgi:hypothetical protein
MSRRIFKEEELKNHLYATFEEIYEYCKTNYDDKQETLDEFITAITYVNIKKK